MPFIGERAQRIRAWLSAGSPSLPLLIWGVSLSCNKPLPWVHLHAESHESNSSKFQNVRVFCCCYYCSITKLCLSLCDSWTVANQSPLSSTIPQNLLKFMSFKSIVLSNHLILCGPLLLSSVFVSIRVFFEWIGSLHQVAKILYLQLYHQFNEYWTSNEYSGLIYFSIDWFDLLVSKELLMSLPQYHSLKASVPWPSAFFMVQLSYPYKATGKTISLTI